MTRSIKFWFILKRKVLFSFVFNAQGFKKQHMLLETSNMIQTIGNIASVI